MRKFFVLLVLSACPHPTPYQPPGRLNATAANGGTLTIDSGDLKGVKLVIPPGALDRDTVITVDVGSKIVMNTVAGPSAAFSPSGLAFKTPAQLTLPLTLSGKIYIAVWEASGIVSTIPSSAVTVTSGTASFSVSGFTTFQPGLDESDAGVTCASGVPDLETDGDGVPDGCDNCPAVANANQADTDCDGLGDVCDADVDGDGISNAQDNCPTIPNAAQTKTTAGATLGDACNSDDDGDGIPDNADNCPLVANADQQIPSGAVCNTDLDLDNVGDGFDNCPSVKNPNQLDTDGNGIGDACECHLGMTQPVPDAGTPTLDAGCTLTGADTDGDGVVDVCDNCPAAVNASQVDTDCDGLGDVCDADIDGDGVPNASDNCPSIPNADQHMTLGTGTLGDACNPDDDGDGIADTVDNCPLVANANQVIPSGATCNVDIDSDSVGDSFDNCPGVANPNQLDTDGNGIGDACQCQ